jgi:cupin 2 domain-containing protein
VEYVQVQDEWVVVLDGEAVLEVDGAEVRLARGDWVLLPAAKPHRVLMTAAGTRWLAVHVHIRSDSTGNPPV